MSAPDRNDTYTLDELTSAADVTVRTVRYYIAEGLLPPPEGSGRGARYSAHHRDRLDVIGSLKQRHLPLKEIRHHLQQLAPDELTDLACEVRLEADTDRSPMVRGSVADEDVTYASAHMAEPNESTSGDSPALDYIRSIREEPIPHRHVPVPPAESDRQWRRLPISPDAELMVSDDLYRRRREQIESLLTWARRVINEP